MSTNAISGRPVVVPEAERFAEVDRLMGALLSAVETIERDLVWCNESQSVTEWDRRGRPDKDEMPPEPDVDPDHLGRIVTFARTLTTYDLMVLGEAVSNIEEQALMLATNYAPEAYFAAFPLAERTGDDA